MDTDFVADDKAACFRYGMELQTVLFTVDLAADGDTCAGIPPGVLYHASEFCIQLHLFGDVPDSEVAIYFIGAVVVHILEFGSGESDLWIFRALEEVRRMKMSVPLLVACCNRAYVDGEIYPGRHKILVFRLDLRVKLRELAADSGDHHMPDLEFNFRVRGIEYPFGCSHSLMFKH